MQRSPGAVVMAGFQSQEGAGVFNNRTKTPRSFAHLKIAEEFDMLVVHAIYINSLSLRFL